MKTISKALNKAEYAENIDDIIFEGRNHKYGAYFLRKHYNDHLLLSLVSILMVAFTAIIVPAFRSALNPDLVIEPMKTFVLLEPVSLEDIFLPPPPPQKPNTAPPTSSTKTSATFTVVESVPQGQEQKTVIDLTPPALPEKKGPVGSFVFEPKAPVPTTTGITHTTGTVTKKPKFKGGDENKFREWLGRTIRYPESALETGIFGKIILRFAIDKDGKVCDVSIQRGINPLLDQAAVEAILRSPKWEPAEYKGEKVKMFYVIPLQFNIEKQ